MSLILWNTFFYIVIPEIVQLFTLRTVFKELFGFFNGVTCNPFSLSSPHLFPTQVLTASTEFFGKPSRRCQLCWGPKPAYWGCPAPRLVSYPLDDSRNFTSQPSLRTNDMTLPECQAGWLP